MSYTTKDARGEWEPPHWTFMGILSLFDPPRPDTKETIRLANESGIEVKMVTGDHTVIAKETCRELGMGTNILNTEVLNDKNIPQSQLDAIILNSHGFAEVMPSIYSNIIISYSLIYPLFVPVIFFTYCFSTV
jgi:H+-transporting ATPase